MKMRRKMTRGDDGKRRGGEEGWRRGREVTEVERRRNGDRRGVRWR